MKLLLCALAHRASLQGARVVAHLNLVALRELGITERGHERTAHLAGPQVGKPIQHRLRGRLGERPCRSRGLRGFPSGSIARSCERHPALGASIA
jgi:hypothetical protein